MYSKYAASRVDVVFLSLPALTPPGLSANDQIMCSDEDVPRAALYNEKLRLSRFGISDHTAIWEVLGLL